MSAAAASHSRALKGARWAVAGAGVVGVLTALRLAQMGAAVTLCDAAAPADNASGVAAGMLAPAAEAVLDPHTGLGFADLAAARDLWPALAQETGVVLDRSGALLTVPSADEAFAALAASGARGEVVAAAMAIERAPGLWIDRPVVFTDEDWRLDAVAALMRLREAAVEAGVVIAPHRVSRRDLAAGRVWLSNGEDLKADGLVLATGASDGLCGAQTLIAPVKGQIARSTGGPRIGPVVRGRGVYVVPDAGGAIVGATMEQASDRDIDPAVIARLVEAGATLFPDLATAPYRGAAAVRAASPDGLPLLGRLTDGALVAVGMRRNGWLLAPLAARMIADLAAGDEGAAGAFDLARFANTVAS